mmetsp:Transcript_139201/g.388417  ORF Transcript_139201/g.388417 Transcript_139201/m.388417 type:complete len:233 (-) Transcript_139201:229-927(-)
MDHRGARLAAPGDLLVGQAGHVHGKEPVIQEPKSLQVGERRAFLLAEVAARGLVSSRAVQALCLSLVQVDVQRHAKPLAECTTLGEGRVGAGVRRMKRDRPRQEGLRTEALLRPLALSEVFVGAAAVGPKWELDGDDADGCADARAHHDIADSLREPIHVVEGGHTTHDHLDDCQFGPIAHELRIAQLHLQWPYGGLQPLTKRNVVRNSSQVAHGSMRVRIHKARHQGRTPK